STASTEDAYVKIERLDKACLVSTVLVESKQINARQSQNCRVIFLFIVQFSAWVTQIKPI
ncbi:MAG: hypothetical protein K8S56_08925, partial [Candidatus Cloacimonetes bacterium]|nr:hypothetical protein [Candidatus Cloacimonadota bacterium]